MKTLSRSFRAGWEANTGPTGVLGQRAAESGFPERLNLNERLKLNLSAEALNLRNRVNVQDVDQV
jgi:hypothetical protein